jgi:dephospho-CoA kinase
MVAYPGLFLFGLTGGVASGKSTVGKLLRSYGVTVIDADDLARRAVNPGEPALAEIEQQFGPGLVLDGKLDRTALGKLVFGDATALAKLNAIVHPRVAALLRHELTQLSLGAIAETPTLVCYEVPLLFENHLDVWLRPVVLVACSQQTQVDRAMAREGWSEEHARQRIAAQMPLDLKRARADFVITNESTLEALAQQTQDTLAALHKLALAAKPSSVA